MPLLTQPVHESNDCHTPAGSPQGGEFCAGLGGPIKVYAAGRRVTLPGRHDVQKVPENVLVVASPVGYVALSRGHLSDAMWVSHAWVKDDVRGRGEGKRLYLAALRAVQKRGFMGIERGDVPGAARGVSVDAQRVWASFERAGRTKVVKDPQGRDRLVLYR